jgi:hypothetical protein
MRHGMVIAKLAAPRDFVETVFAERDFKEIKP